MRRVKVLRQATDEAEAAVAWYENERKGLGAEFSEAIEVALGVLEEDLVPLTSMPGQSGSSGAKRLILRRLPFDIVVVESAEEFLVVAFAHHSRTPGYWRHRTGLLIDE